MIAAFFIKVFDKDSAIDILSKRLEYLKNFYIGISEQIEMLKLQKMPPYIICNVNHNALLIKAFLPETPVKVLADCCAGVTPESHTAALETMKMCQVEVV